MTKYAHIDHASPPNVLGFFNTDEHDYTLPPAADLVVVPDADWDRRITAGAWLWVNGHLALPPVAPAVLAGRLLEAQIAAGLAVTSTSNPSLNTVFALDQLTLTQIGSVARDVGAGLGLPGDTSTFTYPDASGTPRGFTPVQVIALYKAMRDRILLLTTQAAILQQGGTPAWPDATPVALD